MAGLLSDLRDFGQGASNAAASTVSGPLDLLAMLMRKAGIPVPSNAVGGSEWMAQRGLTAQPKNQTAGLLGEAAGLISPIVAQAKAPQIARGLLQAGENAAKPRTLSNQQGAIVWHGSPHKFDKFDSSKIGTGEGAQAYGHGLYLAESPDVARSYQEALSKQVSYGGKRVSETLPFDSPVETAKHAVASRVAKGEDAVSAIRAEAQSWRDQAAFYRQYVKEVPEAAKEAASFEEVAKAVESLEPSAYFKNPGSLYKVDLPDPVIARMLDWDKPLSQQAPEVQKTLSEALHPTIDHWARSSASNPAYNGADLWARLSSTNRTGAAELLRQSGIPGIRYLDGGSRGTGQGTSNFVVFPGEESILRILERNGVSF